MEYDILTVNEAAAILKLAPEKVLDLLMSADLAGRSIGGEWRTTRRAVATFVDGLGQGAGCCGPGCCPAAPPTAAGRVPAEHGWS